MAGPPGTGGGFDPADLEGTPVLDDPLQRFTLLQFQGRSQGRWTNQVILAVVGSALDDL
jgi:hypothetical protein